MMRQMDSAAYEEYKKLSGKDSLKYLMNWYEDALKKKSNMVNEYEQKSAFIFLTQNRDILSSLPVHIIIHFENATKKLQ